MELVYCKMSSSKLLKLNWTPESIPTAWELRPEVDIGDILKLVGGKMFTRKLLKLKWTHEPLPTAGGLSKRITFQAVRLR